jgi:proteasome lid subunit RPN8/RPN11
VIAGPGNLTLRLPGPVRAAILDHCHAARPLEGCGLLLGERAARSATIMEAIATANTRASPQHYEIAPEDVLAADRRARAAGWQLLGAWHSHPGGSAVPSSTDREEAWPDWCYLIVGLGGPGAAELRAWRLLGEDFVEDTLETT